MASTINDIVEAVGGVEALRSLYNAIDSCMEDSGLAYAGGVDMERNAVRDAVKSCVVLWCAERGLSAGTACQNGWHHPVISLENVDIHVVRNDRSKRSRPRTVREMVGLPDPRQLRLEDETVEGRVTAAIVYSSPKAHEATLCGTVSSMSLWFLGPSPEDDMHADVAGIIKMEDAKPAQPIPEAHPIPAPFVTPKKKAANAGA